MRLDGGYVVDYICSLGTTTVSDTGWDVNESAVQFLELLLDQQRQLRVAPRTCDETGATIIDCGIHAAGGYEAGRCLAELCLGTLAEVRLIPARSEFGGGPAIQVYSDLPLQACLGSQYAGWKLAHGDFFAMGSGPFRWAAIKETLYEKLGWLRDETGVALGVLETRNAPPVELIKKIAIDCGVPTADLTLLLAPTASTAGGVQIVARSVETALHKLMELEFNPRLVVSGYGVAPLPPVGKHDLQAIGRTNDAILYGGEVTLTVNCDDELLREIGPRVPSCASDDYGRPFQQIFEHYNGDFYQIDPHLFSPATVCFQNLKTGRTFRFGELRPDLIRVSFEGA